MTSHPHDLPAPALIRLAELAEKLRDDTIADAEVAELEIILAESPAAREAFAGLALLTAELRHRHGRLALPMKGAGPRKFLSMPHLSIRPRWRMPLALAASIGLAALLGGRFLLPWSAPSDEVVATVSNASGATLLADGHAMGVEDGAELRAGA
jgi:ferric-dicitrate binding protein FerR (iron transport regulator)